MEWSYKFAFDEIQKILDNRPWLLDNGKFVEADHDVFLGMQKELYVERGWDWFVNVIRGRFFQQLNLTTVNTWDRERNPGQGDPDISQVQQKYPGASIVSLIGGPHIIGGPEVDSEILSQVVKVADAQHWNQKIADKWKFPAAGMGGAVAWLALSLGLPQAQIGDYLQNGGDLQELMNQAAPENSHTIPDFTEKNVDFEENVPENTEISPKIVDNLTENTNISRGIRNNNPGNIERNKTVWQGMSDNQLDERFINFNSPEYGVRAMARILRNYERKYGLNTIEQIVSRWAPSSENNTESYIQNVSQEVGIPSNATLDLDNDSLLQSLIKAIIHHENGTNPYDDETILQGIALEKSGASYGSYHYAYREIDLIRDKQTGQEIVKHHLAKHPWEPADVLWKKIIQMLRAKNIPKQLFGEFNIYYQQLRSQMINANSWNHIYAENSNTG